MAFLRVLAGVLVVLAAAGSAGGLAAAEGGSATPIGSAELVGTPTMVFSDGFWSGTPRVTYHAACPHNEGARARYWVIDQYGHTAWANPTYPSGWQFADGKPTQSGTIDQSVIMTTSQKGTPVPATAPRETFHAFLQLSCDAGPVDPTTGNSYPSPPAQTVSFSFTLMKGGDTSTGLKVAVRTLAQKGKVAVGATTNVIVRVTATGGAVGAVAVSLVSKQPFLAITSRPSTASGGVSLKKDASFGYQFTVKGVSSGLATLVATATGKSDAGKPLSGADATKLRVGPSASVGVAISAVALAKGVAVGKSVEVPVVVTAGNVDLTGVSLGNGLVASNGRLKVTQAGGLSGFALSAGASRTFMFKVEGVAGGDSSLSVKVVAGSAEGNVSGSATLGVKVLLEIQGTINALPALCRVGTPCPQPKPIGGVAVSAIGTKGGGQTTTGADGTYSIEVPPGSYTVSPSLHKHTFAPSTRSATLSTSDVSKVDFKACPIITSTTPTDVPVLCRAPNIELVHLTALGKDGIELTYGGSEWDPAGGPISISFSGTHINDLPAQAAFARKLTIPLWPKRTTVALAQAGQIKNGYCWGQFGARQGNNAATSEQVRGRWAGWVLWSTNPSVHAGDAWCTGEEGYFVKSNAPMIVFGYVTGVSNAGESHPSVVEFNVGGPGDRMGQPVWRSGDLLRVDVPSYHVCVLVSASTSGSLTVTSSQGACKN
jgi:hypothetical protein